ncbi:MAG: AraC family transcriptional regulator [Nostoc indistinguendum CM1-VF10]|jgi:AraC family transcriptional regulator|nr:AraC family transcriptional regulator [Nostoc indistinguendum CM1-VF10]
MERTLESGIRVLGFPSLSFTCFCDTIIDYVQAHLDQDLSLAEIAAAINISPTYFSRLFKRATGSSPHQYVIQFTFVENSANT